MHKALFFLLCLSSSYALERYYSLYVIRGINFSSLIKHSCFSRDTFYICLSRSGYIFLMNHCVFRHQYVKRRRIVKFIIIIWLVSVFEIFNCEIEIIFLFVCFEIIVLFVCFVCFFVFVCLFFFRNLLLLENVMWFFCVILSA